MSQGKWGFNDVKRKGGWFLWSQIYRAKKMGARFVYGAMWDECVRFLFTLSTFALKFAFCFVFRYDEGTAFMPVVPNKRLLPVSDKFPFMALDEDGYDLPSDWYVPLLLLPSPNSTPPSPL